MCITSEKKALREHILSTRGTQSKQAAERLTVKVTESKQFRSAKCIFCYCAFEGEAETVAIIKTAKQECKQVCIPVCRNGVMYAVCEKSGIDIPAEKIDLTLVPGMAFDCDGYRLGYGGGYYDRFLAIKNLSIGLCRAEFFMECLPRELHDMPVNIVLTDD